MTSGHTSTVTDAEIAAALAKHGNRRRDAAYEAHCSEWKIDDYCARFGIPRPPKRQKSCNSYTPVIRWDADNVTRLHKLFLDDGLSVDEIAADFGTTPITIRTAMSRTGLTRSASKFGDRAKPMQRKCLCCDVPFRSEGPHNRQCPRCFQTNSEMAA